MSGEQDKLDLMKEVAVNHLNRIPAAKSNDPRAFIEEAVNWIGAWWKKRTSWEKITPGYCALVLNHEFAANATLGFSEKFHFRDAPDPHLGGHIHVADFSLTRVFRDAGGCADADSVHRRLLQLNLGDAPCILFDPESGTLLVGQNGVAGKLISTKMTAFDGNLTVQNVDRIIKELYETSLKYPENFPQIWWEQDKFVPMFEAEKLYQNLLYLYLKALTQETWVVVREDQTNAGRTDLTLSVLNPSLTFVVEMKVLRSFFFHALGKPWRKWSKKKNEDWANEGVDQVIDYRTAKQAKEAFLLLYDMRKNHAPVSKVASRCCTESVLVRKYDIFNASARDIREAKKPKRKRPKTR